MALKTRHIEQNKQTQRTLRPDTKYLEKWDKTIDMVHWESNSLIKRHPHIDPAKIIAKSSTHDFPADAITVRFRNQRLKDVGVYFYGKREQSSSAWGVKNNYSYINQKLLVTLPYTRTSSHPQVAARTKYLVKTGNITLFSYGFSFKGELPQDMDMETLKIALDYIKDTIGEIN